MASFHGNYTTHFYYKSHPEISKCFNDILIITTFLMNSCHCPHFRGQNTVTSHNLNDSLSFTLEMCSKGMKHIQIQRLHILNCQSKVLHFKCNVLLCLIFVQNLRLNLNSYSLTICMLCDHKKRLTT